VNPEGVGSGGAQSLLTAPRRANPGADASIGPCELIFLGRKRRCSFVNTRTHRPIGCYSDGVRLVQVVLEVANSLRRQKEPHALGGVIPHFYWFILGEMDQLRCYCAHLDIWCATALLVFGPICTSGVELRCFWQQTAYCLFF
jgi:hypothetical protein